MPCPYWGNHISISRSISLAFSLVCIMSSTEYTDVGISEGEPVENGTGSGPVAQFPRLGHPSLIAVHGGPPVSDTNANKSEDAHLSAASASQSLPTRASINRWHRWRDLAISVAAVSRIRSVFGKNWLKLFDFHTNARIKRSWSGPRHFGSDVLR